MFDKKKSNAPEPDQVGGQVVSVGRDLASPKFRERITVLLDDGQRVVMVDSKGSYKKGSRVSAATVRKKALR